MDSSMTNLMRRSGLAVLALGLLCVAEGRSDAGLVVEVTADNNGINSVFGTLNLSTGQYTQVATMSVLVSSLTSISNGTLYASDSNGNLYSVSGGGGLTPFGSIPPPNVPAGGSQFGYLGLANAGSNGFYGVNLNANPGTGSSFPGTLDHITANGTSVSTVGTLGSQLNGFSSGDLAYGPNGSLYFTSFNVNADPELFQVNTTTGLATEVGTGLGLSNTQGLTLVNAGGQLYGIDTFEPSGSGPIGIYTINTTTGVATATGVTVSGLGPATPSTRPPPSLSQAALSCSGSAFPRSDCASPGVAARSADLPRPWMARSRIRRSPRANSPSSPAVPGR
jgi:hypothetical protein